MMLAAPSEGDGVWRQRPVLGDQPLERLDAVSLPGVPVGV
jgi:hypothetical protein